MSQHLTPKVLVVGGGPGGYPAAIRAGQLGLDTVIVDADRLGGTCLIRGCIPSKAVIHAASQFHAMTAAHTAKDGLMGISVGAPSLDMAKMTAWKDGVVDTLSAGVGGLLKGAGVTSVTGWATFENAKTCTVETPDGPVKITAEHVILATGSRPVELSFLPFDDARVISSTGALALTERPGALVVVGAGYIGLELGIAFAKLGSKVTVVEAADRILPGYDAELTRPVAAWLKRAGVTVHLGAKARGLGGTKTRRGLSVDLSDGSSAVVPADKILVAVGRAPCTQGWGLERMGVDMAGAFVKVDQRCATAMRQVWAIGDLVGEPMLAHKATAQGEMVAEIIAGQRRVFDPRAIAAVCFTEPEIVGAGLAPDEARAAGHEVVVGKFPLAASGRALSMGAAEGFVRVTARATDHVILGVHAVGAHVSELSGEFALALEMGAVLEDIAGAIHVHPTLTEAFAESALTALGHPIHITAPRTR